MRTGTSCSRSALVPETNEDVKVSGLGTVLADIEPMLSDDDKREIIEHARLRARLAQAHERAAELDSESTDKGDLTPSNGSSARVRIALDCRKGCRDGDGEAEAVCGRGDHRQAA